MPKTASLVACLLVLGCQAPESSEQRLLRNAFSAPDHDCQQVLSLMLAATGIGSTLPLAVDASSRPRPEIALPAEAEDPAIPAELTALMPQHAAVAKSMLVALDTRIGVILDNIANVNTPGFKRSVVYLGTITPQQAIPGLQVLQQDQAGNSVPSGAYVGSGTQVLNITKVYSPGALEITERSLDVAIDGAGFFQILLPDGNTGYTRAGHFLVNADGRLVNLAGHILQPEISFPPDCLEINIDPSGRVTGRTATSPDTTHQFGEIRLTNFMNPSGLLPEGNNVLRQTDASGSPTVDGTPGESGLGSLTQGFIERSNVQIVSELIDLYQARREYDVILQSLTATGVIGTVGRDR